MGCTIDGCLRSDHSKQQRYLDRIKQLPNNEFKAIQSDPINRENHLKLFQKGYRFLLQQNIEQASMFFKTLIASHSSFNQQIDGIGSNEDQIGYYEHNQVDWFFQKSIKKTPYDALSLCFLINQRYDQSETWYKLIIQDKPKLYQPILGLGHSYFNRKQYFKAKQLYLRVIQIAPNFDKPYQLIAFICKINEQNNEQAVKWAQKCLKINPQNFYSSFIIAICEQNLKKKIKKIKKVIGKNQKYGRAYNSLGNALKHNKSYEQAIKYYNKCIQISPRYDAPYHGIGNIYRQKQMFQQSIIWYQKSIAINPLADKSYNALGNAYYEMKQYDKSIQVYLKCIEINPQFSPPYYGIGIAYRHKLMMEQSIQWLKKSSDINPCYEIPYNTLGNVYIQLKQYDQAIQFFHKSMLMNKESLQIYLSLAKVYNLKEQYDKSLKFYNKALEIDLNCVEAFYGIAGVYKKNQQFEKAVQYYQKCIAIDQKLQAAYYQLGKLYKKRKQYHRAQKWYKKCLTVNPESHHTLNSIGNIESEKGNYNLAIQWYLKSIQCNPTYGPPHYGLGNAYFILNQYQKSQQCYRKCIQINPKNEHPFNGLGNICTSLKNYGEAINWYTKSIDINPQNDASYYGLGNVYSDQQCLQQAIAWYQKCLQKNENNPLCLTNLGFVYLKMQNFRQAFNYFSRAKEAIFLDDRLTSKNQQFLEDHLVKFELEAQEWQTKRLTGFISKQDKQKLSYIIKNFESKVKYLYQTSSNKNIINHNSVGVNINMDFTRLIQLIFQDKFKLTKIEQIFNTVHTLFKTDQNYFHIIPQLFCQYFWNERFIANKPIVKIEQSLYSIIQKESQIYANTKDKHFQNKSIGAKNIIKLTICEEKGEEINLFKDTAFFPSYQQLYIEIKKINQKAFQSQQLFSDLVHHVKKSGHGFQESISQKIPKQENKQFKVMIRIMQKMFKEIKSRKNDIISKLDKKINEGTVTNFQSVVHEIVKVWTDEIDIILANRMNKKIPTLCFISDLIRGKCYFQNIKDIQTAIVKTEEVCQQNGYIILQLQNRLSKPQTKDVVLKIAIKEAVCELQLALSQNTKQYHFIHCIYEISRSPLGCIFGSFLFMAKEIKYPFVQRCKDIAEKLEGKSSLKHRVVVKKIKYILDMIEDKQQSRLK